LTAETFVSKGFQTLIFICYGQKPTFQAKVRFKFTVKFKQSANGASEQRAERHQPHTS